MQTIPIFDDTTKSTGEKHRLISFIMGEKNNGHVSFYIHLQFDR